MASIAVFGHEYLLHPDKIEERGPFDQRFLAEGDSWMDRSSLTQLSFLRAVGETSLGANIRLFHTNPGE